MDRSSPLLRSTALRSGSLSVSRFSLYFGVLAEPLRSLQPMERRLPYLISVNSDNY